LSYERTGCWLGLRRPAGVTSTGRTSPPTSSAWAVQATRSDILQRHLHSD